MSTSIERPPETAEAAALPAPGGLSPSRREGGLAPQPAVEGPPATEPVSSTTAALTVTLSSLPVGARLVMRCRKDWRAATVASIEPDGVRLSVASPTGHTYRVRRPADSALTYEGALPLLGEVAPAGWRAALARYDVRW